MVKWTDKDADQIIKENPYVLGLRISLRKYVNQQAFKNHQGKFMNKIFPDFVAMMDAPVNEVPKFLGLDEVITTVAEWRIKNNR